MPHIPFNTAMSIVGSRKVTLEKNACGFLVVAPTSAQVAATVSFVTNSNERHLITMKHALDAGYDIKETEAKDSFDVYSAGWSHLCYIAIAGGPINVTDL